MTIPLAGALLALALGWSLWSLRQDSIRALEEMRTEIQERIEFIVGQGSRLAETYSNIYQLLLEAQRFEGEEELYRMARPQLDALHAIEASMSRELTLYESDPEVSEEINRLIEALEQTRVTSTNALLLSTVDFELAPIQIREVTRKFNTANRRFLRVETMLHEDLNTRLGQIVSTLQQRTRMLGITGAAVLAAALAGIVLLIARLLRSVRQSVLRVAQITSAGAGAGHPAAAGTGNELALLDRAIADATDNHDQLHLTSQSLRESNEALQRRETALSRSNEELAAKIEELNEALEAKAAAETALSKAQRMEAIGNLTGGVAHDFNNLLAVILGNLELLREEENPGEREKLREAAQEATLRGADLTRNMLAFARRAPLEPKVLDLNAIVRRTKNWAGRTLPATISVETSLLAGLWQIEADEGSLESALLNLILNARDAMPDGGRLTIETANVRIDEEYISQRGEDIPPGRYVMLAVSDTGTGMTPEVLDRIFDPFFTTKPPGSGSGLGLSMIEGFTRQSGGTVRVYTEPGNGTTFKLYFSALASTVESATTAAEALPVTPGSATVFVVEDEPGVLEVLVQTLERAGYSVRHASSGDEALELFTADPAADVLVTDIVMPGTLQGTGLARELRKRWPELPVVFMSGYASEATVHGNGLRPEDIRLMKPVARTDLLRAIEKARQVRPSTGG